MNAKTTTTTKTTKANKAASNTPVAQTFASYLDRMTDPAKKAALIEAEKTAKAKKANTAQRKTGLFALVAGTVCKIEHKALNKAVSYHVSKGNLSRTPEGIKLTAQGATLWNADRVKPNADTFQKIAAFVNGGSNLPEFGGEKKTAVKVGNKQLPSLEYWGGFVTTNMRLCFAALWSSK